MDAKAALFAVLLAAVVPACATSQPPTPQPQTQTQQDAAFGHALTLVEALMDIAARSDTPEKDMDAVLAGQRPEVNQALAALLEDATAGMPAEHRSRIAAIGKDFALAARRHAAQAPEAKGVSSSAALQARKDLTAMGLRYYDPSDFLDAVKRDDLLAVELFIAGRGVNLAARDAQGRDA